MGASGWYGEKPAEFCLCVSVLQAFPKAAQRIKRQTTKKKSQIPPRTNKTLINVKESFANVLCEEQLLSDGASPHAKSHYLQFNTLISSEPMQRSIFVAALHHLEWTTREDVSKWRAHSRFSACFLERSSRNNGPFRPFPGQRVRRRGGETDSLWPAESGRFARGDPSPSRCRRRRRRTRLGRGAAGPKSSRPLHCAMSQTQIESDSWAPHYDLAP